MFCKKLPFDSLFSNESYIFPVGFLCALRMYHARLYIVEKMGFGMAPRQCGIHSKPQPLLWKIYIFHASETLAAYIGVCLYTLDLAHIRRPLPTYLGRGPL